MTVATALDLPALLALPPADAIAPALREAMLGVPGNAFEGAPDPPAVLVDMLGSLARLGADGDVTAAALLRSLPAVQAGLGRGFTPDVKEAWATVYGLLATTMKNAARDAVAAA